MWYMLNLFDLKSVDKSDTGFALSCFSCRTFICFRTLELEVRMILWWAPALSSLFSDLTEISCAFIILFKIMELETDQGMDSVFYSNFYELCCVFWHFFLLFLSNERPDAAYFTVNVYSWLTYIVATNYSLMRQLCVICVPLRSWRGGGTMCTLLFLFLT